MGHSVTMESVCLNHRENEGRKFRSPKASAPPFMFVCRVKPLWKVTCMNLVPCTPVFHGVRCVVVVLCCVVSCLCVSVKKTKKHTHDAHTSRYVVVVHVSLFMLLSTCLCRGRCRGCFRNVVVSSCVLVALSSCGGPRVAVTVAVVVPRSSCWCRVLFLLSPCRRVVVLVLVSS